jgi:DNA-binding transcriptional LysR family regulator
MSSPIIEYFYNHQPIGRWIALHYGKRPKKIPVRFFAATAEMVMAMVREGAGIGVVPKYLLASAEASKGLKIVRPTEERLNDYVWFLERASLERSALHCVFRSRLLEHF